MDENRIPEFLCGYFNAGHPGAELVPETWRDGCASLWLTGGGADTVYVDGSRRMAIPFEIRIRCHGRTVNDRLDAIAFFTNLGTIIASGQADIAVTSGAYKSAVYENGEEEYRASYVLKYHKSN